MFAGRFVGPGNDPVFHPADAPSPDERLALGQALGDLPADERAATLLCLGHGLTHAEAARALGVPLGTLKSRVARGRQRLVSLLQEECG